MSMSYLRPRRQTRPTVLFVDRVYPPADGDAGGVLKEMAENLVQRGWHVTILAGPARSTGMSSEAPGIRVVRVGALSACTLGLAASLLLHLALLVRAIALGPFDVVVTKSDPPLIAVIGTLLGLLYRSKTVHWEQDLFPEVAEAFGSLKRSGAAAGVLRGVSSSALKRHDRVVAVGRCMLERLLTRGVARERIEVIQNWPLSSLRPIEHRSNTFRRDNGLQGKFVVMYSGGLDEARPVDALLEASVEIKGAYPDIRFVLTGDGPRRDAVAARIEAEGLDTVHLVPTESLPELSSRLSAGDLHVVALREDVCGYTVPRDLYGAMAVRRPCLFLGPDQSEAALFLREHGGGEVVSDAAQQGLPLRILGWYQNDVRRRIAGDRAYRAVRLLRANALIKFDEMLRAVLREQAAEAVEAGTTFTPNALAAPRVRSDLLTARRRDRPHTSRIEIR